MAAEVPNLRPDVLITVRTGLCDERFPLPEIHSRKRPMVFMCMNRVSNVKIDSLVS